MVSFTSAWNFAAHSTRNRASMRSWKFELCQRVQPATKTSRITKRSMDQGREGVARRFACHKKSPAAHKVTLDFIWRMPNGARPLRRFRAYFFGVALESTYAGCSPLLSDSMLIKSRTPGNDAPS